MTEISNYFITILNFIKNLWSDSMIFRLFVVLVSCIFFIEFVFSIYARVCGTKRL